MPDRSPSVDTVGGGLLSCAYGVNPLGLVYIFLLWKGSIMAEMDRMGAEPGALNKGGHVRKRHARGGSTAPEPKGSESINEYNAQGSPEMSEAKNRTPAFKRGGKLKDGGMAEGEEARERMDRPKRAAGGRAGSSPYSSGHELTPPKVDRNSGHENVGAA